MEKVDDDVDEFIRESTRADDLSALDAMIREALPGADRVLWRGRMWGGTDQAIIGYATIRQARPRGSEVEWFLIGLAEQKKHLSIYVNAAENGAYLVQERASRLGKVKVGAAAVTFRAATDLDVTEFRAMLARAQELDAGAQASGSADSAS